MPVQSETTTQDVPSTKMNDAILSFMDSLSETQKISQLFLVNIEGKNSFSPVEFDTDGNPAIPGGFILFSYNIADSVEKTKSFTDSIRDYCVTRNSIPPFLAIDHEGGSVNRLRGVSKNPLASPRVVAKRFSPEQAESIYYEQGLLLKSLGIHLNLAPVIEIATNENAAFLDDRSYGDFAQVTAYAARAINGYDSAGVAAAVKHFPGNTNDDPHTGLPVIFAHGDELEKNFIAPFRFFLQRDSQNVVNAQKKPAGVLMSHARVEGIDDAPAGLSKHWVSVLRGEIGFDGLIISDDVYMAALEKNGYPPEKAAVRAVEAGVTILMISEKRFLPALNALKTRAAADENFKAQIDDAVRRVIRFKIEQRIIAADTAAFDE